MSLALYRTYRPAQLSEVIGQEHITEPLARAIDADQIHHAYLFTGPRGCGKTSTARILARSLNCVQGPTSTPCGVCDSCTELAPTGGGSIDVLELDAATNRGIDDARDLREKAAYAPVRDRYKVYILDEAHQLTPEAANALLKLIEEPPAHMRFVLATTEPDKIPATIRSRTHHYPFRLVGTRRLQRHLAWVCEQEGRAADPAALALVASAGQGSVRDALSILGQLLAGAGTGDLTLADATNQLGITDTVLLDRFVTAVAAGDAPELFTLVDALIDAGGDPKRFATDVLRRYRDLLVCKHVPTAIERGLLDLPDEQQAALQEQQAMYTIAGLTRAADLVSAAISELKGATTPRLQLELLVARLLIPEIDDTTAGVITRVEKLERTPPPSISAAAAGTSSTAAAPEPSQPRAAASPPPVRPPTRTRQAGTSAPPARPTPGARPVAPAEHSDTSSVPVTTSVAEVAARWPAVIAAVQEHSRVLGMMLLGTRPLEITGRTLVISHPDGNRHRALLTHVNHPRLLETALAEQFGTPLTVDVILDHSIPPPAAVLDLVEESSDPRDVIIDDVSPVALVQRELGGSVVEEYDQS